MTKMARIYLGISLTLNVLFAGVLLGHTLHHYFFSTDNKRAVEELLEQFPANKRKMVEDTLTSAWNDMAAFHTQIAEEKKIAVHMISADTFDEQRYITQAQHLLDLSKQLKMRMAKTVVELSGKLTLQERQLLAEIVSYPPPNAAPCTGTSSAR